METNYQAIQKDYLDEAWTRPGTELAQVFAGRYEDGVIHCRAFGVDCVIEREAVYLDGRLETGPQGILIALYAKHARTATPALTIPVAFKELPGSMPYQGAFQASAEQVLVPYVEGIREKAPLILERFDGAVNQDAPSGDFSFTLYPLALVPLYYIFHLPDEEFPAAVTCLFAANATLFMPLDGLADTAEYTAKAMIDLLASNAGQ